MEKEHFIKVMRSLESQTRKDRQFVLKLSVLFDTGGHGFQMYDNSVLTDCIKGFLEPLYDMEEINRFCYELDFGKAKGADLTSAEELWEHINLN